VTTEERVVIIPGDQPEKGIDATEGKEDKEEEEVKILSILLLLFV